MKEFQFPPAKFDVFQEDQLLEVEDIAQGSWKSAKKKSVKIVTDSLPRLIVAVASRALRVKVWPVSAGAAQGEAWCEYPGFPSLVVRIAYFTLCLPSASSYATFRDGTHPQTASRCVRKSVGHGPSPSCSHLREWVTEIGSP